MLRAPVEHGTGYTEVIVLSRSTRVHRSGLAHFGFECHKLLISATAHRTIDKLDLIGLHGGMKLFEQIRAANGVDQERAVFDPTRRQSG